MKLFEVNFSVFYTGQGIDQIKFLIRAYREWLRPFPTSEKFIEKLKWIVFLYCFVWIRVFCRDDDFCVSEFFLQLLLDYFQVASFCVGVMGCNDTGA